MPPDDPEAPTLADLLDDLAGRPDEGTRLSRLRARAVAAAERATTWGPAAPVAEVGWRAYRRDQAMAGSVLASAVAYRLFIWVLPLMLVLVAGLGLVTPGADDAAQVVDDAGLGGVIADSIGDATESTSAWARLAIVVGGSLALLYETYVLLRALRATSAFAWRVPVRPMRAPVVKTLTLLGLILGAAAAGSVTRALGDYIDAPLGWVVASVALLTWPVAFVALSVYLLPTRTSRWTAHLPGGLLLSGLMVGIHLFNILVLFPWLARKQETYGVLGVAAGILFSLFVLGRALSVSATLNAVLYDGRRRAGPAEP